MRKREKLGVLSNVPTPQTFPGTIKVPADIWASRSVFCVERNSLDMEVMRNYLKSCLGRIAPTIASSTFTVSTVA